MAAFQNKKYFPSSPEKAMGVISLSPDSQTERYVPSADPILTWDYPALSSTDEICDCGIHRGCRDTQSRPTPFVQELQVFCVLRLCLSDTMGGSVIRTSLSLAG